MKVSCSVVVYNSSLKRVLEVVRSFVGSIDLEKKHLFIIDNSESNSAEIADAIEGLGEVSYIFNGRNVGYGAGHNIAMRKSIELGYDFHAILNPDISFSKNVLHALATKLTEKVAVSHIMPKILYPDGSVQYLCKMLPSPWDLFFRRFLPLEVMKKRRDFYYELRGYDYEDELERVPALSGCFMFLRLSTVAKIGYFDESIFMYMEDFDLTRRICEEATNLYFPSCSVIHEYEKGSYKSWRLLKYHIKSAIYYFNKWGWFQDLKRVENISKFIKINSEKKRFDS